MAVREQLAMEVTCHSGTLILWVLTWRLHNGYISNSCQATSGGGKEGDVTGKRETAGL